MWLNHISVSTALMLLYHWHFERYRRLPAHLPYVRPSVAHGGSGEIECPRESKFLPSNFYRSTFHGFRILWTKFLLMNSAWIHFWQKSISVGIRYLFSGFHKYHMTDTGIYGARKRRISTDGRQIERILSRASSSTVTSRKTAGRAD